MKTWFLSCSRLLPIVFSALVSTLGLIGLSCMGQQRLVVTVTNFPQGATDLSALVMIKGGKDAQSPYNFPLGTLVRDNKDLSYRFGLRIPKEHTGTLVIAVAAFAPGGCILSTGSIEADLDSDQENAAVVLEAPPKEYSRDGRCVAGPLIIRQVSQLGPAPGSDGGRLQISGWGFTNDTLVSFAAGTSCSSIPAGVATLATGLMRKSPILLEVDAPVLPNPTGRLDTCLLIRGNAGGEARIPHTLLTLTFARSTYVLSPLQHPESLVLSDLNGDKILDVALALRVLPPKVGGQNVGKVAVLLGQGGGKLPGKNITPDPIEPEVALFEAEPTLYETGSDARSLTSADFDGDKLPDLAVSSSQDGVVTVMRNQGSGRFGEFRPVRTGAKSDQVITGDLNQDGRPDLLTLHDTLTGILSPSLITTGNFGSMGFGASVSFFPGPGVSQMQIADMDGNGTDDVVLTLLKLFFDQNGMAVADKTGGGVRIMLNNRGTFTDYFRIPEALAAISELTYPVAGNFAQLRIADLDGKNGPDVVTTGLSGMGSKDGEQISVLLNDGKGGLSQINHYPANRKPFSLAIGDLDGDKIPDVVVSNPVQDLRGQISFLRNQGGGVFPQKDLPTYPMGVDNGAIALGDVDGDGKLDLVVANFGTANPMDPARSSPGTVMVYRNTSALRPSPP